VPVDVKIPELGGKGGESKGEKKQSLMSAKDRDRLLFDNVSLQLDRGEILVIEGTSGCGKTTLLRIIAGLENPDQGEVFLLGKNPRQYGMADWRTRVAYVCQKLVGFDGTPRDLYKVFQHLSAQQKLRKSRAKEEKEGKVSLDVNLEDLLQDWGANPNLLDREWSRLSSGEHQRISLALAIALKPDVLLLDEPTGNLDEATSKTVEKTLTTLPIPIVWVTHDSKQAQRVGHYHLRFPGPVLTKIRRDQDQGEKEKVIVSSS